MNREHRLRSERNQNEAELRELDSLLRLDPTNQAAMFRRAMLSAPEVRRVILERLLQLNPEHHDAQQALYDLITPPPTPPSEDDVFSEAVPDEPDYGEMADMADELPASEVTLRDPLEAYAPTFEARRIDQEVGHNSTNDAPTDAWVEYVADVDSEIAAHAQESPAVTAKIETTPMVLDPNALAALEAASPPSPSPQSAPIYEPTRQLMVVPQPQQVASQVLPRVVGALAVVGAAFIVRRLAGR